MSKSAKVFQNYLKSWAEDRGFIADFARKMRVKPPIFYRYMSGETKPSLEQLDRIADALELQPWELIKPDGALPTKAPTEEELLAMLKKRDTQIKELEKQTEAIAKLPKEIIEAAQLISESKVLQEAIIGYIETHKMMSKPKAPVHTIHSAESVIEKKKKPSNNDAS